MLENPSDTTTTVKRYDPPQRNRVPNRRKSGDRFERTNSLGNDGDKNQVTSSKNNTRALDHGEAGINTLPSENPLPGLIPINGCCSSEAAQLLNERWAAAMRLHNDPLIDLSERPVMYSGASGSAWGHSKLPPQIDFLAELRRAMRNSANAGKMLNAADHS
ncbi:uncharacterized protein LOC131240287 [Magnolia sinica]|uniref:uncharacterized protein LOC131240287 n=1 Tax=Magnolia sinica TaxID=86752 RepID=UPI00265A2048|nr:uncharacterized protein LOC131240287 [Magnolia sinica]